MSAHNTKWTGNFHQLLFWRRMYCLRNHPVDPKYGFGFDYTQKKKKKKKRQNQFKCFSKFAGCRPKPHLLWTVKQNLTSCGQLNIDGTKEKCQTFKFKEMLYFQFKLMCTEVLPISKLKHPHMNYNTKQTNLNRQDKSAN